MNKEHLDDDVQKSRLTQLHRMMVQWDEAFTVAATENVYEPATMKFQPCDTFPSGKEYSPDVWLPKNGEFVEIKGPPPSQEEFEKCRLNISDLSIQISHF